MLTKGPVAVFLPAVVFFVYLATQKRLGDLRHMMLPTGAIISLAIVVPWYYLLYREHGWEYIGSFIFGENLGRYADAVGEQSRGMLFYIPVMLADLFPWSVMIPLAIVWAIRDERHNPVARLLVAWIAAIVVFFSFSGTKEDLYILPIVPAEAALIGAMLAKARSKVARQAGRWREPPPGRRAPRRRCCSSRGPARSGFSQSPIVTRSTAVLSSARRRSPEASLLWSGCSAAGYLPRS